MVRLSRCCTPVPGDEIIGFVTRGRGVSRAPRRLRQRRLAGRRPGRPDHRGRVGRATASAASSSRPSRSKALDRARLLRDVSATLSDHHVNILSCSTHTGADRISKMRFDFELADPATSTRVLAPSAHRLRLRRLPRRPRQRRLTPLLFLFQRRRVGGQVGRWAATKR